MGLVFFKIFFCKLQNQLVFQKKTLDEAFGYSLPLLMKQHASYARIKPDLCLDLISSAVC